MAKNKENDEEWVEKGQIKTVALHILDIIVLAIFFYFWWELYGIIQMQL